MPKRTTKADRPAGPAPEVAPPVISGHFSTDAEVAEAEAARAFRRQIAFWAGAFVLLVGFLYLFSSILLPFAAGMVLAYFLDPVADRLERWLGSRLIAAIVILLAFVIAVVLALMVIVPILATQGADLISKMPDYLARLQTLITNIDPEWLKQRFGVDPSNLRTALNSLVSQGSGLVTTIFESIWTSGLALVNVAGLIVVTPVVAFYMLVDWDRMVEKVDSWVPREHVATVREIFSDINASTAGFLRGQGTLCLILGIMYAVGLTVVGLNFGLLIGLFAGLISFIPYVGSLVGLVLSVGVALVQFWPDWVMIASVAGIFFLGQFIEGNILQPKLVGDSVGVHPVWLMFALLAFGSLFGFVGLLIAVPAAAAVAVVVRFMLRRYLASPLYRGPGPGAA